MKTIGTCPVCGAPLPSDAPAGLCPPCLLKTDLPTHLGVEQSPPATFAPRRPPVPGEMFGGYRIARLLGSGGMGTVYEADHIESGRRVALKVLGHALNSVAARERFLREGRLAASINHPNSVYVYGTEEISGTPAIAMELVGGGTLQERVQQHGPMPVGAAVDAVLQIIAGLEAAQAFGILHRDIKPSNCFVETDGTVKVGDFGLSISTDAHADTNVTAAGSILGTPAFASPEQLRGEELNTRSDLYSVGVTLFFLLTGHTPFEADNFVKLLSLVLEEPPPSPVKFRAETPRGLARILSRCLAKQPGDRFKDYAELRRALFPYSSTAPTPATLGLRFAAGAIDLFLISGITDVVQLMAWGTPAPLMNPQTFLSPKYVAAALGGMACWLLYYAVAEGLWGASVGKALCGLRVFGADRQFPGVPRALLRALIYVVPSQLPLWICFGLGFDPMKLATGEGVAGKLVMLSFYAGLALLFVTARRRNGFAAIQDLLTRTRVVNKSAYQARPVLSAQAETAPSTEAALKIGPYHLIESLGKTADGEWLLGYDTRLLRKVWLRVVPATAPPVPAPWRALGRAGRLRWLNARREAGGTEPSWDAYEAVSGQSLVKLCQRPQSWSWAVARYWLFDLAEELAVAAKDSTTPAALALDRVWISDSGRAKLLDFSAPGTQSEPVSRAIESGAPPPLPPQGGSPAMAPEQRFLSEVATAALEGRGAPDAEPPRRAPTVPLPLHARNFFEKLPTLSSLAEVAATLKPLLRRAPMVTRARRLVIIAACALFPAIVGGGLIIGQRVLEKWRQQQPEMAELIDLLSQQRAASLAEKFGAPATDSQLVEIYIASRFRNVITNPVEWESVLARALIPADSRRFAVASLAAHPNPAEDEIRRADAKVQPRLRSMRQSSIFARPEFALVAVWAGLVIYVALPALLAALIFRGGLILRAVGVAVVRGDGSIASRGRVFWRSLLAWSPFLLSPALLALLSPLLGMVPAGALLATIVFGLVAWSSVLPDRTLPDRLAGTWLVPR